MRFIKISILSILLAVSGACTDGTGFRIDPVLSTDTFELAAPTSRGGLPSALDVTATVGVIGGGRFPETQEDAERWDIAVRVRDGGLAFLPASAFGLTSEAAITPPLAGQTFESVIEAPGRSSFVTDSAVVVEPGAVYVVRSRLITCGISRTPQYAKIQPLEVAEGRVRLQVTTNERCGDPRLVADD